MIKKKLLSLVLAVCMLISMVPMAVFATGDAPTVQFNVENAQSGRTAYKVNDGEWVNLAEGVSVAEGVSNGDTITVRAIPNQDQQLDGEFRIEGRTEFIGTADLQTEAGWSFTCTENKNYEVRVGYRNGGGNPDPGNPNPSNPPASSGELRFTCQGQAITGGSIYYKLNNAGDFIKVSEENNQYNSITLTDADTSIAIKFVVNEGYQLDTVRGVLLRVNGEVAFRSTDENIADFTSESGYTFNLSELVSGSSVSASSFELEFGFGTAGGGEPPGEPGESGGDALSMELSRSTSVSGGTFTYEHGTARVVFVRDNGEGAYDGNDARITLNDDVTAVKIILTPEEGYQSILRTGGNEPPVPEPVVENGSSIYTFTREAMEAAGNFIAFTVEFINRSNPGGGDPEPNWHTVSWGGGNVHVENGTVTAERVHLGDKIFTVNREESDASDADNIYPIEDIIGAEGQEGLGEYGLGFGDTDLFIDNSVTNDVSIDFKFVPDYGYQLTDIRTMETSLLGDFTASASEISTFHFPVRQDGGNVHFEVEFTAVEDTMELDSASVTGASIENGGNATNSGNLKMTVKDLAENAVSEELKAQAGESALYLDMNLYQVVSKGGNNGNWETQLEDLEGAITVTLNVPAPAEGSFYYVVREHGDGENAEYSRIEVEFVPDPDNPAVGTVTFETDKFSHYAITEAVSPKFWVYFKPYGVDPDAGKVQVQIGESKRFVDPLERLTYEDNRAPITFTLIPPAEADDCTPIVYVMNTLGTVLEPELTEEDGKFTFTIIPNALSDYDETPNFMVGVYWSEDYELIWPSDGQFMVETEVFTGNESGTILIQPGTTEHASFCSGNKYLYDKRDEESTLHVTFIPKPGKKLVWFQIDDEIYDEVADGSEEGVHPLPELMVDGQCTMTISIPALSSTSKDAVIGAEFADAEEDVAPPTGLTWDGTTAKWDAVEGADHYRVTFMKGYTNNNGEIEWLDMANSGSITDQCEFDFSDRIDSDDSTKYCFRVCAIKNKVCSEEVQSDPYVEETPVTNIAATITAPELGATPDYESVYVSTPANAFKTSKVFWRKIAVDDFKGTDKDKWSYMEENEQFEEGYYYAVLMTFLTNEGYTITESTTGTVNGEAYDDTLRGIKSFTKHSVTLYSVFEPLHAHIAGTEWKSDADNHWHICSVDGCDVIIEASKAAHSYGDDNVCDVCGYTKPVTPPTYVFLDGANGAWTQNTDGTLTFRADGDFSKFTGVKVDGAQIDVKHYTAKSGSTIVTLSTEYLKSLSVGTHSLTIVFVDGECSTNFAVKKTDTVQTEPTNPTKPENSDNPQTGDNTRLGLWIAVLFVSGAGVAGTTIYSRKKKYSKH